MNLIEQAFAEEGYINKVDIYDERTLSLRGKATKELFDFAKKWKAGIKKDGKAITLLIPILSGPELLECKFSTAEFTEDALRSIWKENNERLKAGWGEEASALPPALRTTLRQYQSLGALLALERLQERKACLISDEQGLGKTVIALYVVESLRKLKEVRSCLVIAPLDVCEEWQQMINDFTRTSFCMIPRSRYRTFYSITNYDSLRTGTYAYLPKNPDMIICDEFHNMKNPDAIRTRMVMGLPSKYKLFLSGTPITKRVNDLWPVLNIIDKDMFPSYESFISRYCIVERRVNRQGYGYDTIVGTKNAAELRLYLKDICIRREKSEVELELPPVTRQIIRAPMRGLQDKLYSKTKNQLVAILGKKKSKTMDARAKFTKLRQIVETPFNVGQKDISGKLDSMEDYLDRVVQKGRKIVIVSYFRGTVQCAAKRVEKYGKCVVVDGTCTKQEATKRREEFLNNPDIMFYIGTIDKNKEGINALVVADTIIFLGRHMSAMANEQMEARLDRIGQKNSRIFIVDIFSKGTIEERIYELIMSKTKDFNAIFGSGGRLELDFIEELLEDKKQ